MEEIKGLLTKFKDVFAWSYNELKGLVKKIMNIKLNLWLAHDQGWVIVAFGQKMPPSAIISARQCATIKRVRGAVIEQ